MFNRSTVAKRKMMGVSILGMGLAVLPSFANPSLAQAEEIYELETITVTAQKRTESKANVPMSLEVKTSADIETEGIKNTEDVLKSVPNVAFGGESIGASGVPYVAVRGIGSSLLESDPAVELFVDGIPMSMVQGYTNGLLDIDQIEILRGPQGTLYGRNTVAGAINITTNKPVLNDTASSIKIGAGTKDQYLVEGITNIPLVEDRSALRMALAYDSLGSVWDNELGGDIGSHDNFRGRISYLQLVGDSTTIDFSADLSLQDQTFGNVMTLEDYRNDADKVSMRDPWNGSNNSGGVKLEVNTELDDGANITSLTGYRRIEYDINGEAHPNGYLKNTNAIYNAPFDNNTYMGGFTGYQMMYNTGRQDEIDIFTQELRYTSPEDQNLKYVVGLYGDFTKTDRINFQQDIWESDPFGLGVKGANMRFDSQQESLSLATFADATYDFEEHWQVFGGVRLGYDQKDFNFKATDGQDQWLFRNMYGNPIENYHDTLEHWYATPRFGLKYKFDEGNNIYTLVSRGYKSGGYNSSIIYDEKIFKYDEEGTWNYELGMKNTFFDNHLTIDSAVFYIDWENQQIFNYNAVMNSPYVANAKGSRSYGIEVDMNARFDNGFRLGLSGGYADATYTDYEGAMRTGSGTFDASGKQQQNHSKFTGAINLGYDMPLPWDELLASFDVFYRYRSDYYLDVENLIKQDGYGTVDANITVGNDTYEFSLWAKNILDKQVMESAQFYGDNAGYSNLEKDTVVSVSDPFTIGATFKIMF